MAIKYLISSLVSGLLLSGVAASATQCYEFRQAITSPTTGIEKTFIITILRAFYSDSGLADRIAVSEENSYINETHAILACHDEPDNSLDRLCTIEDDGGQFHLRHILARRNQPETLKLETNGYITAFLAEMDPDLRIAVLPQGGPTLSLDLLRILGPVECREKFPESTPIVVFPPTEPSLEQN